MNHRQAIHRIPETIVSSLTQAEGLITGTLVKMFTIVPVIVSGTVASAMFGLLLVLLGGA